MKTIKINNIVKSLLMLIIYITLFGIGTMWLYENSAADPFLHEHVGAIMYTLSISKLILTDPAFRNYPAFGSLIVVISRVTSISPTVLEFIPIAGAIYLAVLPNTIKKLTNNLGLSSILSISLAIFFIYIFPYNYSIWPHAFGYILFLLFVTLILEPFTDNNRGNFSFKFILLIIIIGLSTNLFSYSSSIWEISLVVFTLILLSPSKRGSKHKLLIILGIIVVLFLSTQQVIYQRVLPNILINSEIDYYKFSLGYSMQVITYHSSNNILYVPPKIPILTVIRISIYTMILFPIIIALKSFKNIALGYNDSSTSRLKVGIVLLLIWAVDTGAYLLNGSTITGIIFRYISLVGPIIAGIYALYVFKEKPNYVAIYFIALLISSIISFSLVVHYGLIMTSNDHYHGVDEGAEWWYTATMGINHREIVSDHYTLGRFKIIDGMRKKLFRPYVNGYYFDRNTYKMLISSNTVPPPSYMYFAIWIKDISKKVVGDNWINYKPFRGYIESMSTNPHIQKVYTNTKLWIFKGGN